MTSGFVRTRFAKLALLFLSLTLIVAAPRVLAKKKDQPDSAPNEQKRAVHALNRLTFGARPGDVQQVMAMGVDRWIDLQLHPEKISDAALQARIEPFRTLHMSSREIVEEFPDNNLIRQVMDGKKPMPSDPSRRAIFQVQIARMQEKQEKKQEQREETSPRRMEVAAAPAPAAAEPMANDSPAGSAKTAEELAAAAAARLGASLMVRIPWSV